MSNVLGGCRMAVLSLGLALLVLGCRRDAQGTEGRDSGPSAAPTLASSVTSAPQEPAHVDYVGSERCKSCHTAAFTEWSPSQHRQAMQPASSETVLGDFDQKSFTFRGQRSRFVREGDKYRIETLGVVHAGGKREAVTRGFDVKYTFGVAPLQQYLLDAGDGFLQAFRVAYDTRPKAAGGGRWFQLQPGEPTQVGDELHWTGPAYNWNAACADCHSTALRKGYDAAADRYSTSFSEPSVGCEACHGPGARHISQAEAAKFDAARGLVRRLSRHDTRRWERAPGAHIASLVSPRSDSAVDVQACAACHARRAELGGDSLEFDDRYRLSLLTQDLYFADGQVREEVFELGSFLQSKMFAAGVVCADCHEPHSAKLRRPGNALCTGCHEPERYDAPGHHLHAQGSEAAQCVSCHMPTRTYMDVDPRREHRFAVPRPDLSAALGVPNPCTSACHAERRRGAAADVAAAGWAAGVVREHFGDARPPSFAASLAAGRSMASDGRAELLRVVSEARWPAIVRATALGELERYPETSPRDFTALATDPSPLVRRAFATLAGARPAEQRRPLLMPLLSDGVRSVRLEATRGLLDLPVESLPTESRATLARAKADLRLSLEHNADRVGPLLDLARLELSDASDAAALAKVETLFRRALALDPTYAAAYVNYADYLRLLKRDTEAIAILDEGLKKSRDAAALEHALGLAWVRRGDKAKALDHLAKAHRLAPTSGRVGYVYAVALFDSKQREKALEVLEALHRSLPGDLSVLQLLAGYTREAGKPARAEELERILAAAAPSRPPTAPAR